MPGVSIVAVIEEERRAQSQIKLHRRSLRDASDPLSRPSAVFISCYRLNKEAFVMVLEEIQPFLKRSRIPAIIQLATALRFFATGAYQGVIGKDADLSMGRSTVSTMLWRVVNALENKICPHWIKLITTSEEKERAKLHFFTKYQLPGVIGCIDGTHIKISKPTNDEYLYYNRKGTFSINAMIICDHNMKVRAVDACRPGSCHDAFIWGLSGARMYFLNEYRNGDTNSRLLGDSGYGLEPFLITPYKNVTIRTAEHNFNKMHTSARNIVERVIGVLKSRFRCLLGTLVYRPEKVVKIINVCCALHNICREYKLQLDDPILNESEEIDEIDEIDFDDSRDVSQRRLFNAATVIRDRIASQII